MPAPFDRPIVIGHRGAAGYAPEHTLPSYLIAIEQGADFIEPDLVMTRDGHLIARHDNVLDLTTDVASRPEFADRKTTRVVDGVTVSGSWLSEDFTLAEIRRLRAIERIPEVRPENRRFDDMFSVPTLEEIIELVQAMERARGRRIGIYPETKHPTYFKNAGLPMEERLIGILEKYGYTRKTDPVFIQSFEIGNLKRMSKMTQLPLIQLLWIEGSPYDVEAAGGDLTYDKMATPEGLISIAEYAAGVGPEKYRFVIPLDDDENLSAANATTFVRDARAAGLEVHPYTFRAENDFLPANFRSSDVPAEKGDMLGEIKEFLRAGIDGFFTDQPDLGVRARDEFMT